MARLDEATERLQKALDSLEKSLAAQDGQGAAGAQGGGKEAALRAALESANKETASLRRVAVEVTRQLDKLISRVEKAVGS